MGRGKIAVQCSHAAVSSADEARVRFSKWYECWIREGQAKVALKIREVEALLDLEKKARLLPLPAFIVRDKGLTQVSPGEITCLGIGPAPSDLLDSLTEKLPFFWGPRSNGLFS